ncbi:hypothetical protein WJX72_008404 [[Myrmecia] bisecta]|uniref:Ribosome biogenesis regulatory protein n=1 Tax=[Myrmecia] bisecta TaxID=41462 RepID=A0AAW1PQN4_9CHLO
MGDAVTEVAHPPLRVTAEQLGVTPGEEYDGQLEYDLGNLAAFDVSPLDSEALRANPEDSCLELATKITQSLEWRRRHGYKRANDDNDIPVIEAKASDQAGEDPFTKMKAEKKARVKSQDKRQLANLKQQVKLGGSAVLPATIKLAAALPEHGKGKPVKRKEMKADLAGASLRAGVSTASMGKFDKRVTGEKDGERNPAGKRRKFMPLTGNTGAETSKVTGVVDRILREKSDDIIDVNRAVGKLEADRREDRHQAKLTGNTDAEGKLQKAKGRFGKAKGGGKAAPAAPKGGKKSGKRAAKDAKRKR